MDFVTGEIILIDKPKTWTSFDVVNKVRNILRKKYNKKLKVGHAGTLDPLATGLMILATGKKTKTLMSLTGLNKEYIATINFGSTTPSYDLETEVDEIFPKEHIDEKSLKDALNSFLGKQKQLPPRYSAKKINGKKAYELARKGQNVEMKLADVEFFEIEVLEQKLPDWVRVRMLVSKGTYIRTFAYDLGRKLQSGAYLSELRRTRIGNYSIDDAFSIKEFEILLKQHI